MQTWFSFALFWQRFVPHKLDTHIWYLPFYGKLVDPLHTELIIFLCQHTTSSTPQTRYSVQETWEFTVESTTLCGSFFRSKFGKIIENRKIEIGLVKCIMCWNFSDVGWQLSNSLSCLFDRLSITNVKILWIGHI